MVVRWPMFLTPTQLSRIIQQQKNPLTALEIFNEAKTKFPNYRHNGPVYATMIHILGNSGRFDEMKQLIEVMKMDSCECKDSTFAGIFKIYAKAGLLNDAVSLYRSLPEFNCVNWTESFNTLLQIMKKESKLEDFYGLLMEQSQRWAIKSRIVSLNMIMDALCQINRSNLAIQIFVEMNHLCCYPDRDSYKILMTGLCREGRLHEATHLLYAMFWRISQRGCGEDVVIYRTLLDSLCDNGQVNEAVNILRKVLRKGLRSPKDRWKQRELDQLRGISDTERAKLLINEALVRGVVPNPDSYTSMATDLYLEGKIREGDKVLDEMRKRGFCPSVRLYGAKISALCKDNRPDEAGMVIEEEMLKADCVPVSRVYNIVVKGFCNEGKLDSAIRFFKMMVKHKETAPDKETFEVMVDGLCQHGRFNEAIKMVEVMMQKSYWPDTGTFTALIKGLCSTGRLYEAVVWLEEMISQAKSPDSSVWSVLVGSVCGNELQIDNLVEIEHLEVVMKQENEDTD